MTCKVCGKSGKLRRGLCNGHYKKAWRNGGLGAFPLTRTGEGSVGKHGYHAVHHTMTHVVVAEKALGKPLPKGAIVHHVNEDKLDNRPENLVICPDRAYHNFIHQRMRALEACGHADWLKCPYCKQYDAPENLSISRERGYHRACAAAYQWGRKSKAGGI